MHELMHGQVNQTMQVASASAASGAYQSVVISKETKVS